VIAEQSFLDAIGESIVPVVKSSKTALKGIPGLGYIGEGGLGFDGPIVVIECRCRSDAEPNQDWPNAVPEERFSHIRVCFTAFAQFSQTQKFSS
jgi:hypothetical protein